MAGVSLKEQGITKNPVPAHVSVKEAVLPFIKFRGVDIVLGPEMRSTGEVMGISERFSMAFAKSQLAAGTVLPSKAAKYLLSVADRHKPRPIELAKTLVRTRLFASLDQRYGRLVRSGWHVLYRDSRRFKKGIRICSI